MGIAERREREKENLRVQILEAARDILSEHGLDGLSMRAIADRIEYSPATIYLYFQDKDDLIRNVVVEAFRLLSQYMAKALRDVGAEASAGTRYRATGRAYVRFALENPAYFHVMFDIPGVAQMECPEPCDGRVSITEEQSFDFVVGLLGQAAASGEFAVEDPPRAAVIGWALVHGLVSLFLSGRLSEMVTSTDQFMELAESAMDRMRVGWLPRNQPEPGHEGVAAGAEPDPDDVVSSGPEAGPTSGEITVIDADPAIDAGRESDTVTT